MSRDYRDIVGGAILILLGLFLTHHILGRLDLGDIRRMGPGAFPFALSLLLVGFGFIMLVPAFFRAGPKMEFRIFVPLCISAAVISFALLIPRFGLIPAVLSVILIASFADMKASPVVLALLCAGSCAVAYLIFRVGLGLPTPLFDWRF